MKVVIEKIDDFGRGIAYIDGKVVFIPNALVSEEVEIEIIKENKKYLEGKVINYISKSSSRVEDDCRWFVVCGGCNLRHMSFYDENRYKEEKVTNIMKKFAGIDSSVIKSIKYQESEYYRNKVVLHGNGSKLGLYKDKTKDIVEIGECKLLNHKINEIIAILKRINVNIEEAIVKTSNDLLHILVSIKGDINDTEELLKVCDVLIINGKCLTDNDYIPTSIGSKKYYQSVDSFFQINTNLTEKLYDEVYNSLKGNSCGKVLDLYCGTGTIGIYVSDLADKIIGIDYNKSNIGDAERNKRLNSIFNISFICDKVENVIDSFSDIDTIIVDPPRVGLDSKTREYLVKINPQRIVYVSCDPVTLARDLKELSSFYDVVSITPFNMFPGTYHVECVCLLIRKDRY